MRVDRVVRDSDKSLRRVLEALDNNLTARDNFGPEGESGWVLTSRGPDQTPIYKPVTLSPSSTINWSAISDTPNTLGGYGIEDAFTVAQVNALIDTHTHPAEDIVSGILDPLRLGQGPAGESTYLRGDSTWQPRTLAGLGLAGEVAGYLAANALKDVEAPDDWPSVIPGPRGIDGTIGRDGVAGPPGVDGESLEEWPVMIPGPTGAQGATGAPGAPGGGGGSSITQLLLEDGAEPWDYPDGPSAAVALAAPGIIQQLYFEDPVESWDYPNGPSAGGGGGISGAGTNGKLTKWTGATSLGDSIVTEAGNVITVGSNVSPSGTSLAINAVVGGDRDFLYYSAGSLRWVLRANSDAESGANAGTNFDIIRRDDAGALIDAPLRINRASGIVSLPLGLVVGSATAPDATSIVLNTAAGAYSNIRFQRNSLLRWVWEVDDSAESGGDAGTNMLLYRYNDAGAGGLAALTINRASRKLTVGGDISLSRDTTNLYLGRVAADNWQIRYNDDGSAIQLDATKPSWAFAFGEAASDNFGIYRMAAGGAGGYISFWKVTNAGHWTPGADNTRDVGTTAIRVRGVYALFVSNAAQATGEFVGSSGTVSRFGFGSGWTQLNLYTGGTARWHITSAGHYYPVVDNTYDIGQSASLLRVRDIWIAGEVVQANGIGIAAVDQATFINAQTNITNLSWAVGLNEIWAFEAVITYVTSGAGALGVKFYVTVPINVTGEIHYFGNTNAVTAFREDYQAVLTIPATFYGTLSGGTFRYVMHGTVRTTNATGTAQIVGISGGGTTIIQVKKGSRVRAFRQS